MSKNFWHDIETGTDVPEIINKILDFFKDNPQKLYTKQKSKQLENE